MKNRLPQMNTPDVKMYLGEIKLTEEGKYIY